MAERNLVLQLLITAKDEASGALKKLYKWLDDETSVVAGKVRDAFTGMFGGGLDSAIDLEAQLDRVAAKGGYTAEEITQLKGAAQAMGAQFGVTGVEAAKGMESLAAAGLTAAEAMTALPPVLALAASEEISADAAAQKLIDSLSIMGMGFDQTAKMADVLAKAANITTSSAAQLAEALTQAGGMARAAGMGLEETVAALDLLHKNGIKGSAAGTSLKGVLTALLDPSSKASEELNKLGISSRDLGTVMAALKDKGGAANTAILAFGQEAGPGLRALLAEGQGALDDMTLQLENADGAAQKAADEMGGNLKAAMASLNSAWETVKSTFMEPVLEPLAKAVTTLTQSFISAVQGGAFTDLTNAVKTVATVAGETAEKLVKAFDFKAIAAGVNTFIVNGIDVLNQAMNNMGAMVGAVAATAFIPLVQQLNAAYTATMAWIAAQQAAIGAMTRAEIAAMALAKAKAILFGPAGWVMMGVTALALLWEAEDKTKASTDALATSVDEYTKKLKEQTDAQNKVALNKLEESQAALRTELVATALELNKQTTYLEKVTATRRTYGESEAEIAALLRKSSNEALETRARLDTLTQQLNLTEERRQLILKELKERQDALNKSQEDAPKSLEPIKKSLEDYRALLKLYQADHERATTAFLEAQAAFSQGKIGIDDYKKAQEQLNQTTFATIQAERDVFAATQDVISGRNQEKVAVQTVSEVLKQKALITKQQLEVEAQVIDGVKILNASLLANAQAELALAKAKGDGNAIAEAQVRVMVREVEGLKNKRDEQANELQQLEEKARRIGELLSRQDILTVKEAEELELLKQQNPALGAVLVAKQKDIEATEKQIEVKERERKQAEIMAGPIGQLSRLYAEQAQEHERAGEASARYQEAQVKEAEGALKLAQIKGDAQEIDKAQQAIDDQRIAQAQQIAATRQQEAIDTENAVAAKRLELAADGELTKADQEQIASMEAVAAAKRDSAKESQNAADQLGAETDAKRKAAEATKEAAEKEKNLKEETENRESAGKAAAKTMNDALGILEKTGGEMDKLTKRFYEQQGEMTKNAVGWDDWAAGTARAAQEVKQEYETQKGAVDGLLATLQQYNETGEWTAQVQQAMIQSAGDLSNQYDLLDQQTLDNLKGEVEAVNDKLREMQQEAQDAQDRIAELNAEIAAERGDTATADRLKLELEERQAIADLDAQIAKAQMQGNATLLAALEEQRIKLQELYALKKRNLERDIRSRQEQERTSKSQNSSSGGSSGNSATVTSASSTGGGLSNRSNAFSLTVNTTGGIIDANFAEELARKLKPKLDEISRRSL